MSWRNVACSRRRSVDAAVSALSATSCALASAALATLIEPTPFFLAFAADFDAFSFSFSATLCSVMSAAYSAASASLAPIRLFRASFVGALRGRIFSAFPYRTFRSSFPSAALASAAAFASTAARSVVFDV